MAVEHQSLSDHRPAAAAAAAVAGGPEDRRTRLRRNLPSLALVYTATFVLAKWSVIVGTTQTPGRDGSSYMIDYVSIWAAGKLTLAGTPALAYDPAALRLAQDLPSSTPANSLMVWAYPPHAFLLSAPFGAAGFSLSFLMFSLVSLAIWIAAIWRPSSKFKNGWMWMVAAPPLAFCLVTGQPSLLWMAGLAFVLEALRDRREVAAGIVLALMTFKPQFGLLLPIALIAGGYWRTIGAGAVALALLLLGTTLIVGAEAWPAFGEALSRQVGYIENANLRIYWMLGIYPFLRATGLDHDPAMTAQMLAILPLAIIVALVWWRRSTASFDARAAVLCLCAYFSTPHAQFYDGLLPALGALYLARALAADAPLGRGPKVLMLAGAVSISFVFFHGFPIALLVTPLAAIALAMALLEAAATPRRTE